MKKKLVVCGGGSSAHTLIPLLQGSIFDVYVFTSRPQNWANRIDLEWRNPSGEILGAYCGDIVKASNNPEELFKDADYVVLCMPVHKYQTGLAEIAPYISRSKTVCIGTVYGQGGFNWMVDEIRSKYNLTNIVTFAFGLIPWICRIAEYGHKGITYGCKSVNYAATYPKSYFKQIDEEFFEQICYKWFKKGQVKQSDNFISLTLSVDNQIIHTSRCFGLYKVYGKTWKCKSDVPWFYRDYDDISAQLLADLDCDYSKVREMLKKLYPAKDFSYMLDYLALERFSYQSQNTDVKESFVNSQTLVSIQTPVIQNSEGLWELDRNYRFFLDDIYFGNCIAKWIAEKLNIKTPTIDQILHWAQEVRHENIIDNENHLVYNSSDEYSLVKSGYPCHYGFKTIDDIID